MLIILGVAMPFRCQLIYGVLHLSHSFNYSTCTSGLSSWHSTALAFILLREDLLNILAYSLSRILARVDLPGQIFNPANETQKGYVIDFYSLLVSCVFKLLD